MADGLPWLSIWRLILFRQAWGTSWWWPNSASRSWTAENKKKNNLTHLTKLTDFLVELEWLMSDEAPLGFDLTANFVQASLGDILKNGLSLPAAPGWWEFTNNINFSSGVDQSCRYCLYAAEYGSGRLKPWLTHYTFPQVAVSCDILVARRALTDWQKSLYEAVRQR